MKIKIVLSLIVIAVVLIGLYTYVVLRGDKVATNQIEGNRISTTSRDVTLQGAEQRLEKIQYDSAKSDRFDGNYDSAISKLNVLIEKTKNTEQKGLYQIYLAESLYARAQNDDVAHGINLYKDLVNDKAISPRVKASALNGIAVIVLSNDSAFYKTYFYDAPFSGFYQENTDKKRAIQDTYYKILEFSDSTKPNSFAKYAIAGDYFGTLLFNNQIKSEEATSTAAKMLQYVKEGDALNDETLYSTVAILTRNLNRALALSIGGKIVGQKPEEREAGFKVALNKIKEIENISNEQAVKFIDLKTRFYYANFLVGSFGNERYEMIRELLSKFGDIQATDKILYKNLNDYFTLRNDPKKTIYARIILLSKVSPEFKDFLPKLIFCDCMIQFVM